MSSKNRLFKTQKSRILAEIESPTPDASPKGSIDVQILPLINRLNQHDRIFTTSSCSGRVSVFFEGLKKIATTTATPRYSEQNQEAGKTPVGDAVGNAGIGGKGEGGKWLFVSHDPVDAERKSDCEVAEMLLGKEVDEVAATPDEQRLGYVGLGSGDAVGFDISSATRFVHLKFEPMILHIQTSDLETAHTILVAALSAGFRESGIMNLGLGASSFPMVAIRCNGLTIDSIIGIVDGSNGRIKSLVDHTYLKTLLKVCNLRFEDNKRRTDIFSTHIEDALFGDGKGKNEVREDKETRRARKRAEGLKKQKELTTI